MRSAVWAGLVALVGLGGVVRADEGWDRIRLGPGLGVDLRVGHLWLSTTDLACPESPLLAVTRERSGGPTTDWRWGHLARPPSLSVRPPALAPRAGLIAWLNQRDRRLADGDVPFQGGYAADLLRQPKRARRAALRDVRSHWSTKTMRLGTLATAASPGGPLLRRTATGWVVLDRARGHLRIHDASGRLVERRDSHGHRVQYRYEGRELMRAEDEAGRWVRYTLSLLGRPLHVEDWKGRTAQFAVTGTRLTTVDGPTGRRRLFYTPTRALRWVEAPDGRTRHFTYDDRARVRRITLGPRKGFQLVYGYHRQAGPWGEIHALGEVPEGGARALRVEYPPQRADEGPAPMAGSLFSDQPARCRVGLRCGDRWQVLSTQPLAAACRGDFHDGVFEWQRPTEGGGSERAVARCGDAGPGPSP